MERRYLFALLLALLVTRLGVLRSPWDHDVGAFMLISRLWSEGLLPYIDVWDNKAPLIYWIGRVYWATGAPAVAMYVTDVLLTLAGCVAVTGILRRLSVEKGVASALGTLAFVGSLPFHEVGLTEVYACPAFLIGAWFLTISAQNELRPRRVRFAFGGGAFIAAAVSLRPPLVLSAALLLVAAALASWRMRRSLLQVIAGAIAGAIATALFVVGHALWAGYFQLMLKDVIFDNVAYAVGGFSATRSAGMLAWMFRNRIEAGYVAGLAGILGIASAVAWRRTANNTQRALWVVAFGLFALDVAGTFFGRHQFLHYFYHLGWTAPLLLGIALTLRPGLSEKVDPSWTLAATLAVTVMAIFIANPSYSTLHGLYREGGLTTSSRRLEAKARELVPADETILLLDEYSCMGTMARLPNRPGSRHIVASIYDLRQSPVEDSVRYSGLAERLLDEIRASPPDWLIRVHGRSNRLEPWIAENYELRGSTEMLELPDGPGAFDFHRRRRR
jgi:hypothetical protein